MSDKISKVLAIEFQDDEFAVTVLMEPTFDGESPTPHSKVITLTIPNGAFTDALDEINHAAQHIARIEIEETDIRRTVAEERAFIRAAQRRDEAFDEGDNDSMSVLD